MRFMLLILVLVLVLVLAAAAVGAVYVALHLAALEHAVSLLRQRLEDESGPSADGPDDLVRRGGGGSTRARSVPLQGLMEGLRAFFSPGGSERPSHPPPRNPPIALPASTRNAVGGTPITVRVAPVVAETPDEIPPPALSGGPRWNQPPQDVAVAPGSHPPGEELATHAPPAGEPPPLDLEPTGPERDDRVLPRSSPDAREHAPGPARPFDEGAVRDIYALWVRRPEPPPEFPPGWEVIPLRFVRNAQEHAAARPVPLFADAGQIADFVRFSPAGGDEGLVLPHPEAAHSAEVVTLLFPRVDAARLAQADFLVRLSPVPVRRNGAYWEAKP
jgi:hypothetical protein